jgi:hypothetical protein
MQKTLRFGMVDEVLPPDRLLTRAVINRPWKRSLVDDFGLGRTCQLFEG